MLARGTWRRCTISGGGGRADRAHSGLWRIGRIASLHNKPSPPATGRRAAPHGERVAQYPRALTIHYRRSGILDRPVKRRATTVFSGLGAWRHIAERRAACSPDEPPGPALGRARWRYPGSIARGWEVPDIAALIRATGCVIPHRRTPRPISPCFPGPVAPAAIPAVPRMRAGPMPR
jgi:hypothetical protein